MDIISKVSGNGKMTPDCGHGKITESLSSHHPMRNACYWILPPILPLEDGNMEPEWKMFLIFAFSQTPPPITLKPHTISIMDSDEDTSLVDMPMMENLSNLHSMNQALLVLTCGE